MSEGSTSTEELREAIQNLSHNVIESLGDVLMETAGATLAQEAIRSAGKAGLLYREACRSKSRSEFYASLPPVTESVDAVVYWLTLAKDCGQLPEERIAELIGLGRDTSARLRATKLSSSRRSRSE
ncbi:MAG: four helix bundle protein [Puniceicoccales bacterium]